MFFHRKKPHEPVGGAETPESVFFNRRKWIRRASLAALGTGVAAGAGYWGVQQWQGDDEQVLGAGDVGHDTNADLASYFPAKDDERFRYDREETDRAEAARFTNFYEFSRFKTVWRFIDRFKPYPWKVAVGGLCRNPMTLDIEELHRRYADQIVERQYRHRCVERWAMAVPWTGFPLAKLLLDADPLAEARFVRFRSFHRPQVATNQKSRRFQWPYAEGLTLPEAMNDLTLMTVGVYGQPLLKQHGAPVRLVVPWKYGYKSIKSIEQIELVAEEPATFWSTYNPAAYPFESNIDPDVPRPWDQSVEMMLGTGERHPTVKYNGYREFVASLYETV